MNNLIDNRQIRIFISSTFRDMQDERDYLMKRTFQKLRMLAAERDVTLTELDLRWGITKEESESGKVVEICLREIENSIPFFIGIIGNRYGWVPEKDDLDGRVTERFPDVDRYIDQHLSVTEMEMQFGVLERKEDMHAYFFIKKKKGQGSNSGKLIHLKEEVAKSRYPSSTYNSSQDLGRQVEKAFVSLLDMLFPKGKLSELEKERLGQRSFLNQLCQNYIKDEKNFAALDAWLDDEASRQLVVTGESGLGKSALIANWVKEKLADNGCAYNIIYHFTGNGGSESSREHIAKHIASEINDIYGWNSDVCLNKDGKLGDLFTQVSTVADKPLLIVIDAVNQIVDAENAKLLNWLPVPGKNIKLLFSTLEDDRTMDALKRRGCTEIRLHPLDAERRAQMVRSYLKLYAKSLTNKQVERIVNDPQCENTLVLRTLLDELINFGIYEKLDKRIDHYLAGSTVDDFYQTLLDTYEQDFKEYGKKFVMVVLSLIAVSKEGLTENAIVAISECSQRRWSELYCSLAHAFCHRNGKISFAHVALREAVEERYDLKEDASLHRNAIVHHCIPLFKKSNKDAFLELPYQLYMIGSTESAACLYELMKSPAVTATIAYYENSNCRKYWRFLKENGYTLDSFIQRKGELIDKAYDDNQNWHMLYNLTRLLNSFGEYSLSLLFEKEFVECLEACPETSVKALVKAYNDIAEAYSSVAPSCDEEADKNFHLTFEYYMKAVDLSKEHSLSTDLAVAYNGLALLCVKGFMSNEAVQFAKMALNINVDKFGDVNHEVACNYNVLANAYERLEKYGDAVECYEKAVNVLQTLYGEDDYHLIVANYNLASTLYECQRYGEAMQAVNKALLLIERIYGKDYYDLDSYLELRNEIAAKA